MPWRPRQSTKTPDIYKVLNSLNFRATQPTAHRLLRGLVTLAALSGCLLPQDPQVLPDLPPAKNTPPQVVDTDVRPVGTSITIKVGMGCQPQKTITFEVPVKDQDYDEARGAYTDKISSLWIVDPNGANGGFPGRAAPPYSSTDVRFIRNPSEILSAGSTLTVAGQHVLQVIVADGDLVGIGIPQPVPKPLPDGGTFEDPTFTDSYQWNVLTEQGVCP
jgi:hypothetical protein